MSSVIKSGTSSLAFPSAGYLSCHCYLSKQPTSPGIKLQISTGPPNLYNQFELGKMPAIKKLHRTNSCNYGDKREGITQGSRQASLFITEALKWNRRQSAQTYQLFPEHVYIAKRTRQMLAKLYMA